MILSLILYTASTNRAYRGHQFAKSPQETPSRPSCFHRHQRISACDTCTLTLRFLPGGIHSISNSAYRSPSIH